VLGAWCACFRSFTPLVCCCSPPDFRVTCTVPFGGPLFIPRGAKKRIGASECVCVCVCVRAREEGDLVRGRVLVRAASKFGLRSTYLYIHYIHNHQLPYSVRAGGRAILEKHAPPAASIQHPSSVVQPARENRGKKAGRGKGKKTLAAGNPGAFSDHTLAYHSISARYPAHNPSKSKKNLGESRAEQSKAAEKEPKQKRQRLILDSWLFMNLSSPERS
jgi:hypothetical protein